MPRRGWTWKWKPDAPASLTSASWRALSGAPSRVLHGAAPASSGLAADGRPPIVVSATLSSAWGAAQFRLDVLKQLAFEIRKA